MELASAQVHGYDPVSPVLKRVIRESTGTAADVQHRPALEIQPERLRYRSKLQAGTADILLTSQQPYVIVFVNQEFRFGNLPIVNFDATEFYIAFRLTA